MMNRRTADILLEELAEVIQQKNGLISYKDYQIQSLQSKVEELELKLKGEVS